MFSDPKNYDGMLYTIQATLECLFVNLKVHTDTASFGSKDARLKILQSLYVQVLLIPLIEN